MRGIDGKSTLSGQSFVQMNRMSFEFPCNKTEPCPTQLYLQLIRKMRKIKALFINLNERQTEREREMQQPEKNRKREGREGVFWKELRIVKTLSFLMSTVSRVASAVPAYETH